ncbi:MAG TPA: FecR domain-containing protein [Puia sp.]|jgi:hypothetical protein
MMPSDNTYYKNLVLGFIQNRLSSDQARELNAFIERELQEYDDLMNDPEVLLVIEQQMRVSRPELPPVAEERFRQRIQDAVGYARSSRKRVVFPAWWRYAAAIVILCAGGYLWTIKKPVSQKPENKPVLVANALPGKNGAILTLAGGRQVVLDSLGNGVIAEQGKTRVVVRNNQLVYSTSARPNEIMYNTMTTPKGRQFQLVLPDGSHIWLNAASSITYPVSAGNDRTVSITGEAYFEVAQDKSRPFHVKANGMEVEVLGTHFNINSYADEGSIRTTLLEGSVRVIDGAEHAVLKPGQQAVVVSGNQAKISLDASPDIESVIAWKNGKFQFSKASLAEVMRQLSRWYDVEVVIQGNVGQKNFGGEMQRDLNLSDVLEGFKDVGVHFRIEGKKLIVMP